VANRLQPIHDPQAVLSAARELIADPKRRTRSASGRRWRAPQKREPGAWVPTHAEGGGAAGHDLRGGLGRARRARPVFASFDRLE